jgi:autotransporter translocation and assembly factor TamB
MTPARGVVSGTLDLESSFQGRGATAEAIARALTGSGEITATDGRLAKTPTTQAIWNALGLGEQEAVPFRDLSTYFAVRDGRFVTDDLQLDGANARWKASGSLGFDGALDYDVQVELNDALSDAYRKRLGPDLAKLLGGTSGRLVIDLRITGNAAQPDVHVDRDKLVERAREQIGSSVKEKLGSGLRKLLGGSSGPAPADGADTTGSSPEGGGP